MMRNLSDIGHPNSRDYPKILNKISSCTSQIFFVFYSFTKALFNKNKKIVVRQCREQLNIESSMIRSVLT